MLRLNGRALACFLAVALTLACSRPGPPPSPTVALPTPFPTPSQNAAPLFEEDPSDVEDAFRAEVQQATDQARFLAGAPCDRLAAATRENPALVPGLRTYAATLKRIAAQDQALARPGTPVFLKRLDDAFAALDQTLASCGIRA